MAIQIDFFSDPLAIPIVRCPENSHTRFIWHVYMNWHLREEQDNYVYKDVKQV